MARRPHLFTRGHEDLQPGPRARNVEERDAFDTSHLYWLDDIANIYHFCWMVPERRDVPATAGDHLMSTLLGCPQPNLPIPFSIVSRMYLHPDIATMHLFIRSTTPGYGIPMVTWERAGSMSAP